MKNILVPTDFSDCATYATELGFAFAEFFDAQLHLFAKLDIPKNWNDLSAEEQGEYPGQLQIVKNANILFDDWQKKAKERGVKLKTSVAGGKLLQQLQNQVSEKNIDFVVMGSHGASGKNEYFIGSNTQKTVRRLHVPVFVIKNPLKDYSFKNVVYASSFNTEDREPFQKFLDFIKFFKPETIHLLAINTSGWFGQPTLLMREAMKDFKAMCGDQPCYTHFHKDLSVDVGIRHFAEDINADLIVVSNHNRHPLKRIFSGSNVEALVNHCEVPILSIDYVEKPAEVPKKKLTF